MSKRQSIFSRVGRLFSKPTDAASKVRSLDAAASGRRWNGVATGFGSQGVLPQESATAARRAAHFARNNPHAASAVASLAANIAGSGIKPRSGHPDPAVRDQLHALWGTWCEETGFNAQAELAVRSMIIDGETFGRFRTVDDGSMTVPFRVDLIHREQVPVDLTRDFGDRRIRAGIEFSADGDRTAIHIWRSRPNDPLAPLVVNPLDAIRIPVADALHVYRQDEIGQVRGTTWLAPILLRLKDLDGFEDSTALRQHMAAMMAAFVTDPNGASDGSAALLPPSLEPGAIIQLAPGQGIEFPDLPSTADFGPFVKNNLRATASGIGLTYERLTGDLENVNFSSIRAGEIEFRRKLDTLQYNTVIPQLHGPVWRRFVTMAVLSGAIDGDIDELLPVDWLPPRVEYVNPKDEVEADILAIGAGLKSRAQAIAERGYDIEQIDTEQAADKAREKRLGLAYGAAPTPTKAPENAQAA